MIKYHITIWYNIVSYEMTEYCIILHAVIVLSLLFWHNTISYHIVWYNTILYNNMIQYILYHIHVILYNTILYHMIFNSYWLPMLHLVFIKVVHLNYFKETVLHRKELCIGCLQKKKEETQRITSKLKKKTRFLYHFIWKMHTTRENVMSAFFNISKMFVHISLLF